MRPIKIKDHIPLLNFQKDQFHIKKSISINKYKQKGLHLSKL
jgi:hypothetical protein